MRCEVKTERVQFMVTKLPEPRNDGDGRQKRDRESKEFLWQVEVVAMDETGAEVLKVVVDGPTAPKVMPGQYVAISGLVVSPWEMNGRAGLSYRAQAIAPIKQGAPS
jgi:hypothetical protein